MATRLVHTQMHQLAGLGIGQRPEQYGFDNAEDGGIGADTQSEGEHGG